MLLLLVVATVMSSGVESLNAPNNSNSDPEVDGPASNRAIASGITIRQHEQNSTSFNVSGGCVDEELDAIIPDASLESQLLQISSRDTEETYPVQRRTNARPFGHLYERDPPVFQRKTTSFTSQSRDYKLVCYYDGWSQDRPAPFNLSVNDIDPCLCTHLIYSFAGLKANGYTIQASNEELEVVRGAYKSAVSLKQQNPALKVMIAIGGWDESGQKYSEMVSTKERRDKFIKSVINFLQEHRFDGLDLAWEFPGATDRGGRSSDKANFASLVVELSEAFRLNGWVLSAAVSPIMFRVNDGYDVPRLAQHLDFISIMTYDLRGPWHGKADHHAPIESRSSDTWEYKTLNIKDAINYWVLKGAPKEKLLMGIPFYGRSFTLANANNTQPGARAKSPGNKGQYTQERGFLAYYEICMEEENSGWIQRQDEAGGPYMTKEDQWVGWDDSTYINEKIEMVNKEGFGGVMVWAIDLDDYTGKCGPKWPLLKTIHQGLAIQTRQRDQNKRICDGPSNVTTHPQNKRICDGPSNVTTHPPPPSLSDSYKVICYFPNWSGNRRGVGEYNISHIDPSLCTHIVYAYAILDGNSLTIKAYDERIDYDEKYYEKVTDLRSNGVKVLLSTGGIFDSKNSKYSRLVQTSDHRNTFIEHVIQFLNEHNFDGLDFNWKYPVCWQGDCSRGPDSDKANFLTFIKELKKAFKLHGLLLSATAPHDITFISKGYDVPALTHYLDWMTVLAYNYHTHEDNQTGHGAPLYSHSQDDDITLNINYTIHYLINEGVDPKKLVLGMPFYGQTFTLDQSSVNTLNQKTTGAGAAGLFTISSGSLSYYEICNNTLNDEWTVVRDPEESMGPYAYKGDQWVSFDDIDFTRYKAEWVKKMGLGGVIIWELSFDDFRNNCNCEKYPLLKTINRSLRNYTEPDPDCKLLGGPDPFMDEPVTELGILPEQIVPTTINGV